MADWHGKHVIVVGAARQGLALARYLAEHGALVTLTDQRPASQLESAYEALSSLSQEVSARITWACGGHPIELLEVGAERRLVDLVCPSGGVPLAIPLIAAARQRGILLSNDSQVFLEACPCRVIGITGSAGKTTTTTLLGRMAQAHTQRVWVGGNIGTPLIAVVDQMRPGDLAVMELSSFQLEIMTRSVQIAMLLNITPNHLDRHGTMQAYTAAKERILTYQGVEDIAVLGRDDPGAWALAARAQGKVISFGLNCPPLGETGTFVMRDASGEQMVAWWDGKAAQPLFPKAQIALRGVHNLLNVLAACAASMAAGIPVQAMQAGVEGFSGVAHRLELVRTLAGVTWYNDSIATAPERSMASIQAFDQPGQDTPQQPIILLAGGRDKNLPWDDFATLVRQRVDHLILFGEAVDKIQQAVGEIRPGTRPYTLECCAGLHEAVLAAARIAEPGDLVLLAPGGTSFDQFRDFEERGEAYRRWVYELS
ncbi:MAG: UDP-N-acetylmuramoyl-L-alanine--D-glutamate ligase [Anaerolineales bacterium]|nr:UDP-N-acetylmuramoyl-L-alanine--D-glutamate ligase [Anaerolineales bacterium]